MNNMAYEFSTSHIKCPIESITGVWKFVRPPFFNYLTYSLSGHLLHYVIEGEYTVLINDRSYAVRKGDIIYYYATEEVETIGSNSSVIFYSVSFQAPKLLPLDMNHRVFPATKKLGSLFTRLFDSYASESMSDRRFLVYAHLLNILHAIQDMHFDFEGKAGEEDLWWHIERQLRSKRTYHPSIEDMIRISGYSKSTIIRSCIKETGTTPIQRIKKIRMEEGRSLLSFGHLNVNQVADYLGYKRMNEFSRDFSMYFGEPPSKLLHKKSSRSSEA